MRRSRRWKWVGAAIVVAVVGAGSYFGWRYWGGWESPATPATGAMQTVRVERGDVLQSLVVYGNVVPKREYTFTFDGDQVSEILVSVGQRVEPDQILVEFDKTRAELTLLQAERALQEAQAEGVPAMIREKELAYDIALASYEETTLRAPFAGVVTEINQATGSLQNWSVVLIDTSELYVEVSVDQLDAPALAVGQQAQALIEPLPDRRWPVELVEIGGMAISHGNSTVVAVTGKLLRTDPAILVGYTVEMEITTAGAVDVLRVPISSLVESPRGWIVMKVVDEEITPQRVMVGVTSDQYAEITSGLEEGDEILLYPSGMQVERPQQPEGAEGMRPPFQQGGGVPPGLPGMP